MTTSTCEVMDSDACALLTLLDCHARALPPPSDCTLNVIVAPTLNFPRQVRQVMKAQTSEVVPDLLDGQEEGVDDGG
eukprot:CAMPEP_0118634700 /NCGR_PEP_ID=MMETSP0785-20121206/1688_1 /TAXON_ID=91992 /ORGANISM="Bolidomonas pacifica, Strain CCMP 1866" /LENGTH=76 /DNA_ID=CAMNT_0006525695 /DNA_START=778 /DNA_END=1008 /DNA_ORIENTATION=+